VIKITKIPKSSQKVIKAAEKKLNESNEVYIDKAINSKIEREISHLGKEKLIVDHLAKLAKKFNKQNKDKILFLLVKLYNLNQQVHESLAKELKNDKKLLNTRVRTKIQKKKVHKDLYVKLMKIANSHYEIVKAYAKQFNPRIKYDKKYIMSIIYHKRQAEKIYKSLANVKMRKTLHRVLLKKLDSVYAALMDFTIDLAKDISKAVKAIDSNKTSSVKKGAKAMQSIVSDKIAVLRSFAYKYTYNVIHSDHFFDFDGNKLVLITKNAHPM
jgi:hypothetical protein